MPEIGGRPGGAPKPSHGKVKVIVKHGTTLRKAAKAKGAKHGTRAGKAKAKLGRARSFR